MSSTQVREALTALREAYDALDGCDLDSLTRTDLLEALDEVQTLGCQLPSVAHRLLARLQTETTANELGAKSWRDVLTVRWRLSTEEANRRLTETALLAPRRTLTGEALPPLLPATATAQRLGFLTADHVTIVRLAMRRLPSWVDPATRDQIEVDWVRHGVGSGPKQLHDQTERTLFRLDQDGPPPDDTERQRRRAITTTKQRSDTTIGLTGTLTPTAHAVWEVLFATLAAPGMCNPADEHPCYSGTPTQAQIDADTRTIAQRRHDAFEHIGRTALDKSDLGQLNGLPTSIIVRTTLQELRERAGIGVTGGGTVMPIADVLHMAARTDATNYLAVFDDATGSVLDLFRTRRTASVAQRLALIARDGGCTKPGCTVPAYGTQVHHAAADWAAGGNTNVDEMALACGPDNRMVGPGGWTTRLTDTHQVEWLPPPHLDTGQTRTNHYHHPEQLRLAPEDAWSPPAAPASPTPADAPDVDDDGWVDEPVDPAADPPPTADESNPYDDNRAREPGSPEPPGSAAA